MPYCSPPGYAQFVKVISVVYVVAGLSLIVYLLGVRFGRGTILTLSIVFGLYFLPSIVASRRAMANKNSVFVINLFLGWTFIGWIIALSMAVGQAKSNKPVVQPAPKPPPNPPVARSVADPPLMFRSAVIRLAVLDELREAGTVTEDEYAAKRQKILDTI